MHDVDPQGYLEFNYLVKHAKGVITDSGGITKEATVMGVPCLILRDNTERSETVTIGTNPFPPGSDACTIGGGAVGKVGDTREMGRQGGEADCRES